jgi:uncharacterized tellurite resistance protein B-like protein
MAPTKGEKQMAEQRLIPTLAKVVVAAAWADGDVDAAEIECLKDLIFRLAQSEDEETAPISGEAWARLEMYIESPVGAAERRRLVAQLQDALRTPADKETAVVALEQMVTADGAVTPAEADVSAEIREAIASASLGGLGRLVQRAVQRRAGAVAEAPNREEAFADYVRNKVFYAVQQRLADEDATLDLDEATARKLSLAGGLMAQIAHVDREVTPEEFASIRNALQREWSLSPAEAALVAEVAISEVSKDLDYYRLTRTFFNSTEAAERIRFLHVLFAVAAADGGISHAESETIRRIGRSLQVEQRTFMAVKATFSDLN